MAGKRTSADKVKKMLAAALGVVMVLVLVYQLFFSGPTPRPTLKNQNANQILTGAAQSKAPDDSTVRKASASSAEGAMLQVQFTDTTPLDLDVLSHAAASAKVGARGNIFAFYVEPPKPPPPPPPPPPIVLTGVNPLSVVASAPQKVTLTVTANKIPADAQIYVDGTPRPTKRISDSQLSIEIEPGEYSVPRTFNVEVKSQNDPAKLNSNVIPFTAQPPPEPGVVYKGRLGDLGQPQSSYVLFEVSATKEIKRLKRGDLLLGVWRIDAITADSVEVTHTQYEIKRRLALQEKPK